MMLVGAEANVFGVDLGFTASTFQLICSAVSYPNHIVSGQAFLGLVLSAPFYRCTECHFHN